MKPKETAKRKWLEWGWEYERHRNYKCYISVRGCCKPRVSPSSKSLTVLAFAALGISYSPSISSKRSACLKFDQVPKDQLLEFIKRVQMSSRFEKRWTKLVLLKYSSQGPSQCSIIDVIKPFVEIFICNYQVKWIAQGDCTR